MYPNSQNTEISRLLGIEWGKASEEEKLPFQEQEMKAREVYKKEMAEWKAKKAIKDAEEAKARSQKLNEKILIAKKNKSGNKHQNFSNYNSNPQEALKSKSSDSLEAWWPEAKQIADFAPLSNTEDRRQYSPDLVPPHLNVPFSRSYEAQHQHWLPLPHPSTNRPYPVQPLYSNPNPYRPPRASTCSPFASQNLSRDDKPEQVASTQCFDQRFIDPGPDDYSPFGSHDEVEDSCSDSLTLL